MVVSMNVRKNHPKNHLMRLQFDLLKPLLVWCFEQKFDKFEEISWSFHHNCDYDRWKIHLVKIKVWSGLELQKK